jgi:hypothetical protein
MRYFSLAISLFAICFGNGERLVGECNLPMCVNKAENLSLQDGQDCFSKGMHLRGRRGHRGHKGHRGRHGDEGNKGHRGKRGPQGATGPAGASIEPVFAQLVRNAEPALISFPYTFDLGQMDVSVPPGNFSLTGVPPTTLTVNQGGYYRIDFSASFTGRLFFTQEPTRVAVTPLKVEVLVNGFTLNTFVFEVLGDTLQNETTLARNVTFNGSREFILTLNPGDSVQFKIQSAPTINTTPANVALLTMLAGPEGDGPFDIFRMMIQKVADI